MKHTKTSKILTVLFAVVLCFGPVGLAGPVGTAFTYQGRLIDNNQPADGLYNFAFTLCKEPNCDIYDPNISCYIGQSTVWGIDVIDGYFTAELDFGDVFDGNERWLEIGVVPADSNEPNLYTTLSPRQKVSPTPYALYAKTAGGGGSSLWQENDVNGPSIYYNNGNVGIGTTNPQSKLSVGGEGSSSYGIYAFNNEIGVYGQGNATGVYGEASGPTGYGGFFTGNRNYFGGNVGIGQLDPSAKLEVAGQVKITDGSQGNGKVLTSDSTGLATWQTPADTGDNLGNHTATQNIQLNGHWLSRDASSEGVYVATGGNVGIGMASPSAKLEVAGQVKITDGSQGNSKVLTSDSTGLATWRTPVAVPDGDPKVGSTTANRVPKWNGTALVDGTMCDNGINVGIGTTNPQSRLSVGGSGDANMGIFVYGDVTGVYGSGWSYGIYGNGLSSGVYGDGWSYGVYGSGWSCGVYGDASDPNGYGGYFAGNRNYFEGKVGIGTLAPGAKLEVAGQVKITGGSPGNGKVLTSDASGLATWQTSSGGGGLSWQVVTDNNEQAVSNTGYIANCPEEVTITLPPSPAVGDVVRISGAGAGGWMVAQNADQSISVASITTWKQRSNGYNYWNSVASSADGTNLVAVANYIYTSTDSGVSWTEQTGVGSQYWYSVASSADGSKLVAVENGGQIYTSTNYGDSWTPRDSNRSWESVASDANGIRLVAVENGGQIYTSTNSGVSWMPRDSNQYWQSVASSSDGTKLVAVVNGGQIYTSTDSGANWTPRDSNRSWQSVASSADGTKLVAVADGDQIYTSTDSGANWWPRESERYWSSVASSADGTKLVAVGDGRIYTSTDSGITWTPQENSPYVSRIASSADGSKLVGIGNQIYTYISITMPGTSGYLTGKQYTVIELQYVGNGRWMPLSHEGSLEAY